MPMIRLCTLPVKTYLNKSKIPGANYVINPYVGCPHKCLYCYAKFMRKFTGHKEEWGDFLDVKIEGAALSPSILFHQHVLLSSVTDPYNPFEKKYGVTRRLLEQLVQCHAYVSILTKSALVVRDIDLLTQLEQCEVALSFSTVDEQVRMQLEPGTSTILQKLQALKTLHQAGIDTAVMAAPFLPGISQWKELLEQTAPYANVIRFDKLNMRGTFQRKLMDFIDAHYPHLLSLYHQIYTRGDESYWQQLGQDILAYGAAHHIQVELFFGKASPSPFEDSPKEEDVDDFSGPDPFQPQLF